MTKRDIELELAKYQKVNMTPSEEDRKWFMCADCNSDQRQHQDYVASFDDVDDY
jgi:hypothetical protein